MRFAFDINRFNILDNAVRLFILRQLKRQS